MKTTKYALLLLNASLLFLSACASTPTQFEGNTMAGEELQTKITDKIIPIFKKSTGCGDVEKISIQILKATRRSDKSLRTVDEEWALSGCGATMTFPVTLARDSLGNSQFKAGDPR